MTDPPDPTANDEAAPPDIDCGAAVAAAMLPLELTILDHYSRQSRCLLDSLPATLGRDEKDDVRLADPWISHSHCELFQQGTALVVRDLDSKNGVFIHGVRVREAEVLPGDCLTLGRTEITLRYQRVTGNEERADEELADEEPADGSTVSLPAAPAPVPRRPITGGPMTEELLY